MGEKGLKCFTCGKENLHIDGIHTCHNPASPELQERAKAYAKERCEYIQRRRDLGLEPYFIRHAIETDYINGALSEIPSTPPKGSIGK